MEKIKNTLTHNKDRISTCLQMFIVIAYVYATVKSVVQKNTKITKRN